MNIGNKNIIDKSRLKIAVQKDGRLTEESLDLLRKSGLEFGSYGAKLFSPCRNYPLDILYVRDDDIPNYVSSGAVDLGIVGQNILYEYRPKVKKLLNLRFGFCSLVIAVPKESKYLNHKDLEGKTLATSYPRSTKDYFDENSTEINIIKIGGSVEIAPLLKIADGIVDLSATGSSLAQNDLRVVDKIYGSEAVLISNNKAVDNDQIKKLVNRLKSVLTAKNYKYVIMNVPKNILPKLKKIIPGLKSPTIIPLSKPDFLSVHAIIKENVFWEAIEKLKENGIWDIFVLPVEKMIE